MYSINSILDVVSMVDAISLLWRRRAVDGGERLGSIIEGTLMFEDVFRLGSSSIRL